MTKYKVVADFRDLQDGDHIYREGHDYPRKGKRLDEDRAAELAGPDNAQGKPLIVAVSDEGEQETSEDEASVVSTRYPKHNGGGWYELSNGETVQGKDAAIEAEAKLQK